MRGQGGGEGVQSEDFRVRGQGLTDGNSNSTKRISLFRCSLARQSLEPYYPSSVQKADLPYRRALESA